MKKSSLTSLFAAVVSLALLTCIEQFLKPDYLFKSACKLVLLFVPIILYSKLSHQEIKEIINFRKLKSAKILYIGMVVAYVGIIIAFMLFRNSIDLNQIRENLMNKEKLTRENCLFVFAYIILVNSFLEEAFFRGFLSHLFAVEGKERIGIIFSAVCFALYHIGMVSNWFDPLIFVICIAGLAGCGILLQLVERHFGTLKASWLIHGCANLAINTIGVIVMFQL